MTNELEKQFFNTLNIEPKYKTCIFKYCKNKKEYDCENCYDFVWHYPQITDRILLELICILNVECSHIYEACSIEELKEDVLFSCIEFYQEIGTPKEIQEFKHQVRTLFEEG